MIRPATASDSKVLTEISFAAKRFWNYPESHFEIWRDELTISENYISKNLVNLIETNRDVIGYYSVVLLENDTQLREFKMKKGVWLEHLFIKPEYIGQGYGTKLMQHLIEISAKNDWSQLKILADPHSTGFYNKLGATYKKEIPSNIEGRTVSYLEWETRLIGSRNQGNKYD